MNKIWRNIKLGDIGIKRSKPLVSTVAYNIGNEKVSKIDPKKLSENLDVYTERMEKLFQKIKYRQKKIPYLALEFKIINVKRLCYREEYKCS